MQFTRRKLVFKAWNQETGLLMRLGSIDCVRGELVRENHILLQFTGLCDQRGEEIYDMDVVLIGGMKMIVAWETELSGWGWSSFPEPGDWKPFVKAIAGEAIRIGNYFELQKTQ